VTDPVRLTAFSHGAGCACKLGPSDLVDLLAGLAPPSHADLLVGTETGDDAAVWRRPGGPSLVATTDFFTPIVDDARTWGRVAAANAVSDVYAMGGHPLFALNLVAWPRDQLPLDLLGEVLAGAAEIAARGGWALVGGHTIDGVEPLYGQAVVGEVDERSLLTNAGARPGDALVLTKALGTGLVATAVKRSDARAVAPGGVLAGPYQAAVESMTTLNAAARDAAIAAGAHAATDVTGFGLLGHLHRMARASGVAAVVEAGAVPLLPGARELLSEGFVAGGTQRNLEFVRPWLAGTFDDADATLLADAQTSGGLLIACPLEAGEETASRLRGEGHVAAVIGSVVGGHAGTVTLR